MDTSEFPENLFIQEDHTLQSFVERVFNDDPQDPNTYTLTLDTDFSNTPEDFKTVFEALSTVFTLAMRLKFANPGTGQVNLLEVTDAQFQRLREYFRSFGFDVFYEAVPITQFNTTNTPSSSTSSSTSLPSTDPSTLPSFDDDVPFPPTPSPTDLFSSPSNPDSIDQTSQHSSSTSTSTSTSIFEQMSHSLDDLETTQADTLEDYFITLNTEHVKFRVWFKFLT